MPKTATYLLRSDRTKSVQVISPLFSIATLVDAKGAKIKELPRGEFDSLYEPELPKVSVAGVDFSKPRAPDPQLAQILEQLGKLASRVEDIHAVVVPAPIDHDEHGD
jgi:hypothetical protein